MAESSWPTVAGSRVVTDDQWELLAATLGTDGVIGRIEGNTPVFGDASGRQVKVRAGGLAQVGGHGWQAGATDNILSIGANSSGSTRIDTVVLSLSRTTWAVTATVKAGTPGAGVGPSLTRNAKGGGSGSWEVPLALVTVTNGAATISAANVANVAWYNYADTIVTTSTNQYQPPAADYTKMRHSDTGNEYVSVSGAWVPAGLWRDTRTLTASASSVTHTIPSSLRTVEVRWTARGDTGLSTTAINMRINGNTGANYSWVIMQVTTPNSGSGQTEMTIGHMYGTSGVAQVYTHGAIRLVGWDNPHARINALIDYGANDPSGGGFWGTGTGLYANSGPFTSLSLHAASGNFIAGSQFTVIGHV